MDRLTEEDTSITQRGAVFNEAYYRTGCGLPYLRNDHWLNFFGGIADHIVRSLKPRRVFDAGCAMGMLVESFWDRGVEAHGVDLSAYAISNVRADMRCYCRVASLVEPIPEKFDLVTCIEVVEHMPEEEAQLAIENLTRAADRILFSSTPSDFTEPTHINVHPTLYWLRSFAAQGFWPDLVFDAGFVAPHAILFYRRAPRLYAEHEILGGFSELLRLRAALVEREQRIGRLNADLDRGADQIALLERDLIASAAALNDIRPALANREERLGSLTVEIDSVRQRAVMAEAAAADAQERFAQIQAAHGNACIELAQHREAISAAHASLTEAQARLADSQTDLAHAREALGTAAQTERKLARQIADLNVGLQNIAAVRDSLRNQLEAAQSRIAALEAQRDSLLASERNLQQDAAGVRRAFDGVISSPGWQAVLRYRRWLWAAYPTSRAVRRWYEPAARSLVRKLIAAPCAPGDAQLEQRSSSAAPELPRQDLSYQRWAEAVDPGAEELALQRNLSAQLAYRPKISVLVPVYKIALEILKQTVDSVRRQSYDNWELAIAHGDPDDAEARRYLDDIARQEDRVKVEFLDANLGISGNSNRALKVCSGEFVALLDHDDTLAPDALFEVALLLNKDSGLDFIYSDKDQLSEDGLRRLDPLFKPQWSPDVMLSANFPTHLCVIRAAQVAEVGGWRSETDGAQDWDLFLRVSERTRRIAHIPKVLYHWRRAATSVATRGLEAKPYAAKAQLGAIQDHLDRAGTPADVAFTPSGLLQARWRGARPSVSVLAVVNGIEDFSFYESLHAIGNRAAEICIVPGGDTPISISPTGRFRILAKSGGIADRLNAAAGQCTGDVLIFLDSTVRPTSDGWIDELAFPLRDPGIGVVGAKTFDPQSSSIRHAGIAFTSDGSLQYPFTGEHDYVCGQFGSANWRRNWLAVSGACFSVRREVFLKAGGFAQHPRYPRLDVDFCLNVVRTLDLRVQYNPFARMWQERLAVLEQWINGDRATASECFLRDFPNGDPYFNPNITCSSGAISLRVPQPPAQAPDHNFAGESRVLVRLFDYTRSDVRASKQSSGPKGARRERRFTWFIPQFANAFYGGIHTVLRFADYFHRAHQVRSAFAVLGNTPPARIAAQIASVSERLAGTADVTVVGDYDALDSVAPSDAGLATLWTTAFYLLRFNKTGRKFYFMQDYEPLFYPAGSTAALVEASYGFGFLGICNTAPLRDLYMRHGGEAEFFDPCIDPSVFFEPQQGRPADPSVLFCYARPGHSRNCFEMLAEALRKLKRRMGDKIAIVTAGEAWNPAQFELDGVVHNLGLLDYRTTGAVYRMAHAGLTMMMTCHPSYLPLELMACNSLVITNVNEHTRWLLRDRENCLLAETSPGAIAETVEEGLRDQALRERIIRNAAETVRQKYQNWDEQAEKVYQYIAARL